MEVKAIHVEFTDLIAIVDILGHREAESIH